MCGCWSIANNGSSRYHISIISDFLLLLLLLWPICRSKHMPIKVWCDLGSSGGEAGGHGRWLIKTRRDLFLIGILLIRGRSCLVSAICDGEGKRTAYIYMYIRILWLPASLSIDSCWSRHPHCRHILAVFFKNIIAAKKS